ncbi:MAG: hypothetical protein KUG82_09910 [Pseudomonadales bacterium]|nr:hypothetical protein [Pseudomonadales bacterium]
MNKCEKSKVTIKFGKQAIFVNYHAQNRFHGFGFLSLILYGLLAWYSLDLERMTLGVFYAVMIALGVIILFVSLDKTSFKNTISLTDIVFWAIAFRIVGVLGAPLFEDDFYRYLWDGFQFASTGDPYFLAPSHFFSDDAVPAIFQSVLNGINYPDIPTIYGPSLQYSFLLGYWLTPGNVQGLQIIYAAVDVALILVLAQLTRSRWAVFLYAWNPLVVKEIAFTAHPDGFGVFFLMLACLCAGRQRYWGVVVFLAVSVCAKPFAWFIAPFILWNTPRRYWLVFTVSVITLYLPFILQSSNVLTGLFAFGKDWQFNSFLYGGLVLFLPALLAKGLSVGGFLLGYLAYAIYFVRNPATTIRYDWILAMLLFCSPVLNPWYWLWVLPFGVLFPSRWVWVTSFALMLAYMTGAYMTGENMNDPTIAAYDIPQWVLALEYGIVGVIILLDVLSQRRNTLNIDRKTIEKTL